MSHAHESRSKSKQIGCAVLTLSDTRTLQNDSSGDLIVRLLVDAGHLVIQRDLIQDEPSDLKNRIEKFLNQTDIEAIITTGGTGVSPRDRTIDVLESIFETKLPGFGELFRMLSYEQIGPATMLSRATGGIANGKVIFALPGSAQAVELAMKKIITPELSHVVTMLQSNSPSPAVLGGRAG